MQSLLSLNVVDLLLDAVCVVNTDSSIVFVSPAFERIFGYTPEEVIGKRMLDMVHPEDLAVTQRQAQSVTAGALQLQFENRYVRKDGSIAHIRWTARWLPDKQVRLAVAHDITERKFTESMQAMIYAISEAAHTTHNLQALFQHIHQIIGRLLPATNFAVALYDADSDSLSFPYRVGDHAPAPAPIPLVQDRLCAEVIRSGSTLLLTPETRAALLPPHTPQQRMPLYWLGVPLQTQKGAIGVLVLQSDTEQARYTEKDKELLQFVSTQVASAIERKQMHERLEHMAQYDQLTHLPNRQLFLDRLKTALARARRDQSLLSLLFLDLDDFKQVNDTLGHAMGDLLLQRVAQRLIESVRGSDTVARLGGDEFVVLLEGGHAREHATAAAEKILAAFSQPFDLEGLRLHIQPSIGVAIYPEHGGEEHHLLGHADEAMYVSKKNGGNQVRVAASTQPSEPGFVAQ
ncbi:PAS domain S-box-containing protein/diguanylate cyclase (GGDEF)-like protein [Acidovorax sp. 69]|uniref:sensor domain-containing protein n=1 Tax=Acidovorax sp. 69 TaxID=2035202 RepID=UPI000C23210D|nr:diguanylate cyclase [Acidovorax sp. 69]PJI97496.1 PAS domain S-box-containing protein/diguanylate cyclase (GGDEF)-like protein [Acidovorax sp. 69]